MAFNINSLFLFLSHLPLAHSRSLRRPGLRVHSLRQDRVDHQGRDGLQHQREALRRLRLRHRDPEPGDLGGLMGPDYNYFERGNLDIFSGRGPCLPAAYLRSQPHLRRLRPQPRLVRQLRRGDSRPGPTYLVTSSCSRSSSGWRPIRRRTSSRRSGATATPTTTLRGRSGPVRVV
ncbi:hypothetical protein M0R45_005158 [Rubus argutus]|uniref:Uncharacterized protein n=1 Tax=Rubus argutus TaxID=59490 RepID=A0AAW1YLT9_RUBAR